MGAVDEGPGWRAAVVIPTLNEAANIERLLRQLRSELPGLHILVVDDGSPDGTAAVAHALGAELGHIEVLSRRGPRGYANSCRDGFERCLDEGFDCVATMDADLSHLPSELPALLAAVRDGADLAIGSRYVEGGSIPRWGLHRRVLSRAGNVYANALLNLGVHDATSGFRAYRATLLRRIGSGATAARGYGFLIEMAHAAASSGARVEERPINFAERTRGKSKMTARMALETAVVVTRAGLAARTLRSSR